MGCFGCLSVIQPPGKHTGEQEGAQGYVENEEVVQDAKMLQSKELRGGGHGDGDVNTVADPNHNGAEVE